jgi:DNA polymerase-3 subunit alpha
MELSQLKISSIKQVGLKRVRDLSIETHHNFIANDVIVHNCTSAGAQKLFMEAKPENITDIAAITSIYRPGPLSAKVDRIYIDAKVYGKKFDWGHPIFEQVLGKTYNSLIFQESVMDLAEHVGGFPKDQCDNVRRAIMKRDHSKGDAAIKEMQVMEDAFVKGAMNKGIIEETARTAYKHVCFMSGYGFNLAHATAYAIDSYMCAWLFTKHPAQWLCAYLDTATGSDSGRRQAFSDVRSLGYEIVPVGVLHASKRWAALPNKKFMPSLLSVKGVGATAADELETLRPFNSIEEMLWNKDGSWRISKFNRRALEALVAIEAFWDVGCIGPDKLFKNHNHLRKVIIDNVYEIKKSPKRDPGFGRRTFYELAKKFENTPDFTRTERIAAALKYYGSVDVATVLTPQQVQKLTAKGVKSLDEFEYKDFYWFVVAKTTLRKSANGRTFWIAEALDAMGGSHKMFIWSADSLNPIPAYSAVIATVSKTQFGMSCSMKEFRIL